MGRTSLVCLSRNIVVEVVAAAIVVVEEEEEEKCQQTLMQLAGKPGR